MKTHISLFLAVALAAAPAFGQNLQKLQAAFDLCAPKNGAPMPMAAGLAFGLVDNQGNVLANGRTGVLALAANTTIGGSSVAALGTITSTSATAFAVGPAGTTSPTFLIDASTTSAVTGIKIKSAATSAGVAISALGGTNEAITLDSKGSGILLLNATATGGVLVGDATNPAFSVIHTSEGTGFKITSAAAASGVAFAAISSGTDENATIDAKGAGTLTLNGTATGNTVIGKGVVTPAVTTLSGDGAITIASGVCVITKGSAAALTLAAPSSQNGKRITIVSTTDFAHVITVTGGLWDGTATANTTATFSVVRGASCTFIAHGTAWYVESLNAVVCAP